MHSFDTIPENWSQFSFREMPFLICVGKVKFRLILIPFNQLALVTVVKNYHV